MKLGIQRGSRLVCRIIGVTLRRDCLYFIRAWGGKPCDGGMGDVALTATAREVDKLAFSGVGDNRVRTLSVGGGRVIEVVK